MFKANLEEIRNHMKELKRESIMIQDDMENRMNDVNVRQQQARYLPKTITEEIAAAKESLHENGVYVAKSTYEQTRDIIVEKLGGELDLTEF